MAGNTAGAKIVTPGGGGGGGGGTVASVTGVQQIHVDNTDPTNPVVHTHNQTTGNDNELVEQLTPGTNVTIGGTAKVPIVNASGGGIAPVTETIQTASYTSVLADQNTIVAMNVATANTFTIPLNSSVAYPIGTLIWIYELGGGVTTVTATSGVTLQSPYTKVQLATQFATVQLRKRGTNTWSLEGDLA